VNGGNSPEALNINVKDFDGTERFVNFDEGLNCTSATSRNSIFSPFALGAVKMPLT
jgi:hypothetical protein